MSVGLLVSLLVATWVVLSVLLPVVASRRARRALQQAAELGRAAARLREEVMSLHVEMTSLRDQVAALRAPAADEGSTPPPMPATPALVPGEPERPDGQDSSVQPERLREPERPEEPESHDEVAGATPQPGQSPAPAPVTATDSATVEVPGSASLTLEERIGANWLLYVGVATLILGSAYFIRYAFENNWVTPWMRVAIGSAAGFGLLEAGRRFSVRGLARFGQMLQGGGVVMLYVAAYAALNIYDLVAPPAAFAWMLVITAAAAWRADREQSQGLAVLAVAGGFLTPFLVGGGPARQGILFGYAALLVAGTLWLARRHAWPSLHLVSWVLTALTIMAWADRYYTPSRRLATELWLTVFAALFVLIWRSLPSSTALASQVAKVVLGTTPIVYHLASLQILWRWTAGLLVYLIGVTTVGVILAGHWRRPGLRLAIWVSVAVPTLSWLSARPARWDTAPFIALAGIYALHLVAQFREEELDGSGPTPVQVALLHLNGLWLWGGLYLLLEKLAPHRLGAVTFAMAAWHMALAVGLWGRARASALNYLALAAALAAAGVAYEFDGAAVTMAWAVEGAALACFGLATGRPWLRAGGLALLAAGLFRVLEELVQPAATAALPLINTRSLVALAVTGLLLLVAWRYERSRPAGLTTAPRVVAGLVVAAALTLLLWASAEVDAWFAREAWAGEASAGIGAVTSANLARDVALSTLWAAYALLLVALGIRRRYRPLRILAIALFATTAAKVFAVDLARLDRFYRILSTVGLGVLLLIASYLYQRVLHVAPGARARFGPADTPHEERPRDDTPATDDR